MFSAIFVLLNSNKIIKLTMSAADL